MGFLAGAFLGILLFFSINIILAAKKMIDPNSTWSAPWFLPQIGFNKLKSEGDGRINILLLGLGGKNHPGGNLTDTVMLVSINPQDKTVVLLSIPRDLYVPIDKAGYNKINFAHAYGEQNQKTTGGGPALSKKTVSQILDLPVHYFVRVDFEGFTKFINELGGLDIYVEKAINDPYFPAANMVGYQPFSISAGQHHMDGALALKYARSRETTSDFDRSKRQQQIMKAILDKSLSLGVLTNPSKIASIIKILSQNIKTDLQIWEIEKTARLLKDAKSENIALKVLDNSPDGLLTNKTDGNGYGLVPKSGNFKEIQSFVHEFLKDPFLESENAKIEVQNGTGKTGAATSFAQLLKNYGYQVVNVTDASTDYYKTVIYDYSGGKKSATLIFLKNRLKLKNVEQLKEITGQKSQSKNADIIVVLGEDFTKSP